jgi:hypothetical protein
MTDIENPEAPSCDEEDKTASAAVHLMCAPSRAQPETAITPEEIRRENRKRWKREREQELSATTQQLVTVHGAPERGGRRRRRDPLPPVRGAESLDRIGSSASEDFNVTLFRQASRSVFVHDDASARDVHTQLQAVGGALRGMAPRDELEAMTLAQLVGLHNAAMECQHRARKAETAELMQDYLNMSAKLSRAFMQGAAVFRRGRSKAKQSVTVKHVHVNKGGQAIVGPVDGGDCE